MPISTDVIYTHPLLATKNINENKKFNENKNSISFLYSITIKIINYIS